MRYDIRKSCAQKITSFYRNVSKNKWYFAYIIDDDTITVVDACHAQNMHEE